MKNIIVSTHDPMAPIRGGGALRTLKAAQEFKKRGHNVMIIAPTEGVAEITGIKVHWLHAPRKQRSQILSSLKFNVRLCRKFLQFAGKTDIFFIHNTVSAACLPFLKPFFGFRFILDITDVHGEYIKIGKRNIIEKLLTPVILAIEYWIIGAADRIIVATNAMKKLLVEKGIRNELINVVYDGADFDSIPFDKEPDAFRNVIHLGTVDRQQSVEYFIRAIPLISIKHPGSKFFIVGGGRELPNIRKLAEELKVSDKCVFTDYVPCEQAREYLKKAAVGVITRIDCIPNRIITTLKLLEYWASKTAVVSSKLEGIAEIATGDKDIVFFSPENHTELAERIISLLEDKAKILRLQENGYQTVKKYTWDNQIPKIVDHSLE